MSKSFDDLFDDFFEGPKKSSSSNKKGDYKKGNHGLDNIPEDLPKPIKDIIETLKNGPQRFEDQEGIDDEDLGAPDSEEREEDGDNFISRKTWDTEFGSITKITIGGELPNDEDPEEFVNRMRNKLGLGHPIGDLYGKDKSKPKKDLTLEEKLDIEISKDTEEGYKEAAKIRDLINLRELDEKNTKESKSSESPENSGGDDFDDFPF
jgi:hypothetical protein